MYRPAGLPAGRYIHLMLHLTRAAPACGGLPRLILLTDTTLLRRGIA